MEDEEYGVSTVDKFRLTYDGPDLEIIERIRRMYERVPFGKSKDDEVEGDRKKKRRKPKFLIRLKTDPEFKRKIILTAGLLWSFMILVGGEKLWTHLSFFPNICFCYLLKYFGGNVAISLWCETNNGCRKMLFGHTPRFIIYHVYIDNLILIHYWFFHYLQYITKYNLVFLCLLFCSWTLMS